MARQRNIEDAIEKYKGNDTGEFFSLKDDKDADIVRFMIEDKLVPEEDWFVCHEVEIEGKKRWVQCTEEGDKCPLCGNGNNPQVKLFLQLIAKSDGKRKLWERGKTFYPKISGLIAKYGDLCNRPYEIERHGKKGDQKTTYEVYPLDRDDKELRDLPFEKQTLLGKYGEGFVLQLTDQEMEDVVDGRYRPEANSGSSRGGNDRDRNSRDNNRDSGRGNDRGRSSSRDNDRDRDRNDDRDRDRGRDNDRNQDRDSQDREASRSSERDSSDDKDPRDRSESRSSTDNSRKRSGSDVF